MVVTSRVLPYRAATNWQFPADEDWRERTIQPLAFGQVRVFVRSWYTALGAHDAELTAQHANERADELIAELEQNERLRPLVQSPLLLTMLALLHYNSGGAIPRDRAKLFDECVQLLLERWEPRRATDLRERSSRLQTLLARLPGLDVDKLRDVIHSLAYEAHAAPPGDDGRGLLDRRSLRGGLLEFFERLRSPTASADADTFLDVIREEAGLLVARDDENAYAFPHLTFQEFLAACWLADQDHLVALAYSRWQGDDRERWRQVLLLLAGRLRQKGQKDVERDGVPWLKLLSAPQVKGMAKEATQRRRDAVLAALSYAEMGGRAALSTSMLDLVGEVETPLRQSIVDLLSQPDPAIPTADRIAAAQVLGELGDPRFPVTLDQWLGETFPTTFGSPPGYWCYVRPGTYRIGGWEEPINEEELSDEDKTVMQPMPHADIILPSFWIARFPITVAQFALFVNEGYRDDAERWWTPNGWAWKIKNHCTQPRFWENVDYHGTNQPVIGVTLYEAIVFCAWLTEYLTDVLPKEYVITLPTEAEWEAAAAYDVAMQRHTYAWGEQPPTTEHAIYGESQVSRTAPVGCCPLGAAGCGARDMLGNILELMTSSYQTYPEGSEKLEKDVAPDIHSISIRGSTYYDSSAKVRCGGRRYGIHNLGLYDLGFRIVVAPRPTP